MKLNISRFFLFAVLAVLTAGFAKAEDTFTIPKDIVVPAGTDVYTLEIGIDNVNPYSEGQMDLVLPSELQLIPYIDEDDEPYFFEYTNRINPRKTNVAQSNPIEDVYRLVFYSDTGAPIRENSGTAFICQIKTKNVPVGTYTIQLANMELSEKNATVDPKDITATLYITEMALTPSVTTAFLNGDPETIKATVVPEGAPVKFTDVVWTSSNPEIATVDNGVVTAVALGETTITATCDVYSASCKVTVTPIVPTSIVMPETLTILIGAEDTVSAEVLPAKAEDKTLTWTTSNENVVSVDQEGNIKGLKIGEATITATTVNGVTASCLVTVNPIEAVGITLSQTELTLYLGSKSDALTVEFDPADTTDKTIAWSSSDETIATVVNGVVTAAGLGEATITATTVNGKTATCKVTVLPIAVESVTLSQTEATILVDETLTLTAEITPADATFKTLTWTSSDEKVATVKEGVVTALGVGEVTITASAHNGISAECVITVNPVEASKIELSYSELTISINGTHEPLEVAFTPANTTDKTIVWSSSDKSVVSIAEDGSFTGLTLGEATITATTVNGKEATCKVTVSPVVATAIELSETELNVLIGSSTPALEVTFTPADTSDKAIKWTSDNESVVKVEKDGTINAVGVGQATITATTTNGISATCTVNVSPIEAVGITLSQSEMSLLIGSTSDAIEVTFDPEDTTIKTITWSSDNEEVATVENGVVTAVGLGEATITATTNNGKTATCNVTVLPIPVETVTLSVAEATILVDETLTLTAEITPEDATFKTLTWTSSDEEVATVEDGVVTALAVGKVTITATATNGVKAECVVTVDPVLATAITFPENEIEVYLGSKFDAPEVAFTPANTTDKTLTWESSNTEVVEVDVKGTITAGGLGEAVITATTTNGVKAELTVKVNPIMATAITLSSTELDVFIGSTNPALEVTFDPENTTDKSITWTSSDEAVVTVAEDGTITAVALGTATITATTVNDIQATCEVTVKPIEAKAITLSEEKLSLVIGSTAEPLTVTFDPEDTTIKTITWSTSDESIVAIDAEGNITAVYVGEATITATTTNDVKAECVVTVLPIEAVTVTLSQTEATILVDETLTLTAEIAPEDATFKTLTWTSSDESVATVEDGVVTALAVGKVTIAATAHNGVKAECVVTVDPVLATAIAFPENEIEVYLGSKFQAPEVTFTPANTTDKTLTWESSNKEVVGVDVNGTITADGLGEATITATSTNGLKAELTVKVNPIEANSIVLSKAETTMVIDSTETLTVLFDPENTTDQTITWSSSDEAVATVEDGVVTAVGVGEATITATTVNGITAECKVTVIPSAVTAISLNASALSVFIGDELKPLEVTFTPENARDKSITWTSSDTNVITIASNGAMKAVGLGKSVITATASSGVSAQCTITVRPYLAQEITLSQSELTLVIGQSHQPLEVTFIPEFTTEKTVTWSSDDLSVVTVAQDGTITAVGVGTTEIVATTSNDLTATCKVTVLPIEANSIALSMTEMSLTLGSTSEALTVIFDPSDTTDKTLTWSSNNEDVATVENGVVTAVGLGEATITASTVNGKTATCKVTVLPIEANGITLSETEMTLIIGSTSEVLTVTFDPAETTDKALTWSSDNEEVATVADGVVTAVGVGEATITVTTVNGKTATCVVTVLPIEVDAIVLSQTEASILLGQTLTLTATVDPEDATYKTLTWSSSNEAVATVADGVVTGVGVGEAVITVEAVNGVKAQCQVTVLPIEANGIALSQTSMTLVLGSTSEALTVTFDPADTTDKTLTWSSSDEAVATVENGVVTAVGVGEATITVTTVNGKTASCVVTVLPIEVDAIVLSQTEASILLGQTLTLTATVDPEDATYKTLTWSSSNEAVATVADGVVTAVGVGQAVITVEAVNGVKAQCLVTVLPIEANGIALSQTSMTLVIGSTSEALTVTFDPADTTDKALTWSSSDEEVATVADGVVTAVGVGEATITVTTVNGKTASCVVTVLPIEVDAIVLSQTQASIMLGQTLTLTATVDPEDATYKTLTWSSSNEAVATVADGVVTAVGVGQAVITVEAVNGVKAQCLVTVLPIEANGIALSQTSMTLVIGSTSEALTVTFDPADTTDKALTWSSSDEEVATVADGVVTAVGVGEATITVTTVNGKTASCVVTVLPIEVESITLSETEITLEIGEMAALTATISPADATFPEITWTSSDEDVAVVSEDGTVYAVAAGNAVITATATNGVTAQCVVTVLQPQASAIELSQYQLNLILGESAQLWATLLPEGSTAEPLAWYSEDETVATVVDGLVTAVGEGSTDIVVVSGELTAICHVVVENPSSAIENASALTGQIKVVDRTIVVDTKALVTVCTSNGAVLYRGYDNQIEVGAAGLYIISVGNQTKKVIIR